MGGLLAAADNVYTDIFAALQGGAVYTQGGAFSRELVVNNRSGSEGGGMAVQGSTTISHTVFAGNIGRLCGGVTLNTPAPTNIRPLPKRHPFLLLFGRCRWSTRGVPYPCIIHAGAARWRRRLRPG